MTETTCRWGGKDEPRWLPGRHADDCNDDQCAGCQTCERDHCRVCGVAHTEHVCPECMAETREALHDIARMCDSLPEEVENHGVEGEAMFLLGPSADPEARGHLEASVAAGRVSPDYLADAIGETHPVWVLGTWDMLWRDALDHDTADLVSMAGAVTYIDQTMTYMATWPHLPFEDFARDLRRCRTHLEAVLHDGEQVDRGAPCLTCRVPLERVWDSSDPKADGWKCPRCKRTSNHAQYVLAVANEYRENADWLTAQDMEIRTGVKAGTVRVWAMRDKVSQRRHSGRVEYRVEDVEKHAGQAS